MLDAPPGVFNATAPSGRSTMGEMLSAAVEASGSEARFIWLSDEDLLRGGVEPWDELPLWAPESQWPGTWRIDVPRATAAGLACRPLADTVRDVSEWLACGGEGELTGYRSEGRVRGLSRDRELELLTARR